MKTYDPYDLALAKAECELDHLFFSRYFFRERQGIRFLVNWHHQLMSDIVEDVIAGRKKNVVITVSPGSSKTELVVINFIARGLAMNPRARFLHLSGSDTLASLNSSSARDLVTSDAYQAFWPLKVADDSKSKKRWNVEIDGQSAGGVYATSLGGQITGFRAGHMAEGFQGCFVAGTRILTKEGSILIDEIKPGDMVLSYNHALSRLELKKVRAVKVSLRSDIAEASFESGRRIRSTPCHRFYDGKSYRPISTFNCGQFAYAISRDALDTLPPLQENIATPALRCVQVNQGRSAFNFLRALVFFGRCKRKRSLKETQKTILSGLSNVVRPLKPSYSNLFKRVRKHGALKTDARSGKFKLPGGQYRLPYFIRTIKAPYQRARQGVQRLWNFAQFSGSPYRPQQAPQQSRKFDSTLSELSCDSSQIAPDALSSLTYFEQEGTPVYDIQVEDNHNFFAEGILVHNCILIDDPIKPEDAFSKVKLEAANRKLLTTVTSRKANPDTPIVIIMQRIAEIDPVGFIERGNVEGDWSFVKIPALIDDAYVKTLAPKYQGLIPFSERAPDGRFSYWPYKEPLKKLLTMERGDGEDLSGSRISRHVFNSQYQQAPVALGGNIIKGEYFERYRILPRITHRKVVADTAQKTKEHNDFSVFEEWGAGSDGKLYLLDMIRGKWEAGELQRRAIAFWNKCKARESEKFGQLRKMMVEDKSSGTGLIQTLRLPPYNIPIEAIERVTDKLTRVMDALPYIEARQVCVPEEGAFTNDFIAESEAFTADNSHEHDDQIDPMLDAINDMLAANKIKIWEANAKRG